MKKAKYGIGFLAAVLVLAAAYHTSYRLTYDNTEDYAAKSEDGEDNEAAQAKSVGNASAESTGDARSESAEDAPEETDETDDVLPADGMYCLTAEDGYVTVYYADRKTVYTYTGIRLDSLPEELRREIADGSKTVGGSEELYGFLENYSS